MKFVCCLIKDGFEILTRMDSIDGRIVADWLACSQQELPTRMSFTGQEAINRLDETLARHGEKPTLLRWVKGCSVAIRSTEHPLIADV